ncbi:MAG: alcohol dehydrogenase catalytic domain-containing protein [Desulfobacterales bacterium]|nr:alcohol dehydrogenase catalytic domain-containing protein [Desulfobacterales bacterium]
MEIAIPPRMPAVVYRAHKGLVLEEIPVPATGPDGVLVAVAHTGFCGSDHALIKTGGLAEGTILGHEVSGRVAACGEAVSGVAIGQRVIIRPSACGACRDCRSGRPYFCQNARRSIGIGDMPGAFATYVRVLPAMLIPVPDGVDARNAALAEAYAAALHAINTVGQRRGAALVVGGGPIGLALVKLLSLMDFDPIVLSEPVAAKRELGKAFGAQATMDPFKDDTGRRVFERTAGHGFDVVFECSGVAGSVPQALDWVARGGDVCIVSLIFDPATIIPLTINFKEARLTGCYSNTHEENRRILRWMAEGRLDGRPLISHRTNLAQLPQVYRECIDPGQAIKVMVDIGESF